jgi:exodeoxyribonuclease VII small subunit
VATQPKASDPGPDPATLSFEDAMDRLEAIVEAMESGEVPLAELLARFEEGGKLLSLCEQRLKAAELKIEQLKRRKDGSLFTESFVPSERPEPGISSS